LPVSGQLNPFRLMRAVFCPSSGYVWCGHCGEQADWQRDFSRAKGESNRTIHIVAECGNVSMLIARVVLASSPTASFFEQPEGTCMQGAAPRNRAQVPTDFSRAKDALPIYFARSVRTLSRVLAFSALPCFVRSTYSSIGASTREVPAAAPRPPAGVPSLQISWGCPESLADRDSARGVHIAEGDSPLGDQMCL
jgi:hypothetical protein